MKKIIPLIFVLLLTACSETSDIRSTLEELEDENLEMIFSEFEVQGLHLSEIETMEGIKLKNSNKKVFEFEGGHVNIYSFPSTHQKDAGMEQLREELLTVDVPASPKDAELPMTIVFILPHFTDSELMERLNAIVQGLESEAEKES
ncbi:hypothetical protein [Planococcus lenghuensis]|uniref:hypothetical protein n=1 Tax=Planococcus lenghuensis TaxID=2213202 RepID=UPI0018DD2940|nr:hypothetical protein [Planococcus lenghuensis]